MNEQKYIIVKSSSLDLPIVFNPILDHSTVAGNMEVVSAGFCRLPDQYNNFFSAWGKSTTLNIESRDEDADILNGMTHIGY